MLQPICVPGEQQTCQLRQLLFWSWGAHAVVYSEILILSTNKMWSEVFHHWISVHPQRVLAMA